MRILLFGLGHVGAAMPGCLAADGHAVTGVDRDKHVHVAQSHFHDIVPANELGLTSIWVNRLGEDAEPAPTREIRDLSALPDTLDELVPQA